MYAQVDKSSTLMENVKNVPNIPYQITNEHNVSIYAKKIKMWTKMVHALTYQILMNALNSREGRKAPGNVKLMSAQIPKKFWKMELVRNVQNILEHKVMKEKCAGQINVINKRYYYLMGSANNVKSMDILLKTERNVCLIIVDIDSILMKQGIVNIVHYSQGHLF